MSERIVDAHVHLWAPELLRYRWLEGSPLNRSIDATDLVATAGPDTEVVLVQADCEPDQATIEIEWLSAQASQLPAVLGIVAFAPLEQEASHVSLAELANQPRVAGVRRLLQDEPPGFALQPAFVRGVNLLGALGLPFDACVRVDQLPELAELVRRAPSTAFVLDHLGKPRVGEADDKWRREITALAGLPNVHCKLSGLGTETGGRPPTAELVRPYLDFALDRFGPERCMFGSDWPVSSQAVSYDRWRNFVSEAAASYGQHATVRIFRENARALYL